MDDAHCALITPPLTSSMDGQGSQNSKIGLKYESQPDWLINEETGGTPGSCVMNVEVV